MYKITKVMVLLILLFSNVKAYENPKDLIYNFETEKWESKWSNGYQYIKKSNKIVPYYSKEAVKFRADEEIKEFKRVKRKLFN